MEELGSDGLKTKLCFHTAFLFQLIFVPLSSLHPPAPRGPTTQGRHTISKKVYVYRPFFIHLPASAASVV